MREYERKPNDIPKPEKSAIEARLFSSIDKLRAGIERTKLVKATDRESHMAVMHPVTRTLLQTFDSVKAILPETKLDAEDDAAKRLLTKYFTDPKSSFPASEVTPARHYVMKDTGHKSSLTTLMLPTEGSVLCLQHDSSLPKEQSITIRKLFAEPTSNWSDPVYLSAQNNLFEAYLNSKSCYTIEHDPDTAELVEAEEFSERQAAAISAFEEVHRVLTTYFRK